MTEAGPAPQEIKQRITRSSIGHAATTVSVSGLVADSIKQEDNTMMERSSSPSNNRSTRSRTSTPTHDTPEVTSSADTTPIMMKRKMGVGVNLPQSTRRSLRSNKLNTDEEPDKFCWICRKDGSLITCQLCPRVFHLKCLGMMLSPSEDWICVECEKVMRSECEDTRPKSLSHLTLDQLILCLQFALERMKVPNSEVFQVPVDPAMEPEYHNIIVHPMDMSQLDKNIKKKTYGSTEAFLADAKWILHNSIIYNGMHNKYTMTAKAILKTCRNQMTEIETCPDCYLASCTQDANWFCKPCKLSHPLVWAKLKGYPFWPAKALREVDGQVDCRFFGAHDKAWVSSSQVFMLSDEPPANIKNKKGSGFDEAMAELEKYIAKFKAKYGTFNYAPLREPYRPDYGQPIVEGKKRKIDSPSTDIPPMKKLAEEKEDDLVVASTKSEALESLEETSTANETNQVLTDLKQESPVKTDFKPVPAGRNYPNGELSGDP